jgi:hypothetical protein
MDFSWKLPFACLQAFLVSVESLLSLPCGPW